MTTLASLSLDIGNGKTLVPPDRLSLVLVLAGFIGSFAFIRMSTRLARSPRFPWWPGSVVSDSGVHVHHLAFGIVLMIAAGALGFGLGTERPWVDIAAAAFGIGVGLTIDEFALWVYLDDVYWSEEGRSSIDATVIAAASMGLILFGVQPFDVSGGSFWAVLESILGVLAILGTVCACFFKGRLMHGAIGFFLYPFALYGALRIGKPGSPWARRFYGERRPGKQAKAVERFQPDRRTERFKQRFRDIVGGVTEERYQAELAEQRKLPDSS